MIHVLEASFRRIRQFFSRSEWSLRVLGLEKAPKGAPLHGLVMIQIDGLSRNQLERALRRGRMPFLRKLLKREGYALHTVYSGIPSTTPAAQGELFYGVKCAVPAFSFRDRDSGKVVSMLSPESALKVQNELAAQGEGLFEGGTAYSNIYTGGAHDPCFCSSSLEIGHVLRNASLLGIISILIWNARSILRLVGLLAVEMFVAIYDAFRGAIALGEFRNELLFVFSRVGVCVGLRELITVLGAVDVTRGVPIVHVNYNGYDEQSHRRGPSSKFAHFSLKGIDDAIKRLWNAAHRSPRRDYEIWIYSDHGQEHCVPYLKENRRTVQEAVAEVFRMDGVRSRRPRRRVASQTSMGMRMEGFLRPEAREREDQPEQEDAKVGGILVAALGPIGHIYPPQGTVDPGRRDALARQLVSKAAIPAVLFPTASGKARAFTPAGRFELPEEAAGLLGGDHPFLEECSKDLIAVCHHPNAGAFIILGFRSEGRQLTFAYENGSHGGPGYEETRAFALLPRNAPVAHTGDYLRHTHLRQASILARSRATRTLSYHRTVRSAEKTLRVMTYNVHGCSGMDGRTSPSRIAKVIAHLEPDVIALQESHKSPECSQARLIADELMNNFHFKHALPVEEDDYGNAILSLSPMRRVHADTLPGLTSRPNIEARGALWVSVDYHGHEIQIINTHLGLYSQERQLQAEALLGPDWAGNPDCEGPLILLGDFNAFPWSSVFRRFSAVFHEVQENMVGRKPRNTFWGRYPVSRIDHIFYSEGLRPLKVDVHRNHMTMVASDHLPLIAEIELP